MRNKAKIVFLSFLLLLGITSTSCVQNDDFDLPKITFEEPAITVNSSIASIKQMYSSSSDTPVLIQGDSLVLQGYVISSDKTGNLYKQLIIQDSPKNPSSGISIATNASDLYTLFEPGRKIYVKLNGLYIGETAGGTISIGSLYQGQIGRMSKQEFENHIFRSTEVTEITPNLITLNQVSDDYLNTLIQLENMQFPSELIGKSYGNMDNTYNVDRPLISCKTKQIINMRNSGFANFKNQLLPKGNGKITAILGKFNDEYQIAIRSTEDVAFTNPRCELTDDTPGNGGVLNLPFNQNFEKAISDQIIDLTGWTNVNINGGSERFKTIEFNTNQYAQISAYGTDENPLEAWLITPAIHLPTIQQNISLSFDTKDGYYNGEGLSVYISIDFSGDVEAATWKKLHANLSSGSKDQYANDFTFSGYIDLSDFRGKVIHIGFNYLGADNGITTTYQIDNIEISKK